MRKFNDYNPYFTCRVLTTIQALVSLVFTDPTTPSDTRDKITLEKGVVDTTVPVTWQAGINHGIAGNTQIEYDNDILGL